MKVSDPSGQTWRVTRRWVPWRRRVRDVPDTGLNGSLDFGDDLVSIIVVALVAIVVLPFVVLGLLAGIELVLIVVVLPFALVGRVFFGHAWSIEARRGWRFVHEESVGSWNDSTVRITELAEEIRRGQMPTSGAPT